MFVLSDLQILNYFKFLNLAVSAMTCNISILFLFSIQKVLKFSYYCKDGATPSPSAPDLTCKLISIAKSNFLFFHCLNFYFSENDKRFQTLMKINFKMQ